MALIEGAEAAVYMAGIIKQLTAVKDVKIRCLVDNKSLHESLLSSKQVENRRLRLDISVLDDMIWREEIKKKVEWVQTSHQIAQGCSQQELKKKNNKKKKKKKNKKKDKSENVLWL
ncbi:unnamed protein product [Meganyctiphanes norvegica]|uniref:Uncharacterized protein n=1 Tax=Meganyctiphanes norvegica TaxID=48144 RepID=A0AAV2SC22_MEGNR